MNQDHILQYIKHPHRIDSSATQEIEHILKQYPYFQTAYLLHIKGLKNNSSIHFNEQLKRAATYAGDRSVLFSLLNNKDAVEYAPEISSTDSLEEQKTEVEKELSKNTETSEPSNTIETTEEQTQEIAETEQTPHSVEEITLKETEEPTPIEDEFSEKNSEKHEELITPDTTEEFISSSDKEKPTISNENHTETTPIPEDIHSLENIKEQEQAKTSESTSENKEQSLAEIISQRLKEIEERDNSITNTATTQPTENTTTTQDKTTHSETTHLSAETETEHSDDLIELSETDTDLTEPNTENSSISQEKTTEEEEKVPEEILPFDFSLETDKEDTQKSNTKKKKNSVHASTMWFKNEQLSKDELDISNPIDAFIAKQPNFKPRLNLEQEEKHETQDISENSVQEGEYLSETLAKIYISQKNYTKALEIYEKLNLKYPQKSVYFANQILEIKQKLK
ncbi:MAG: hypothetical protein PF481_05265 [Bacteroidales bacterium]|jgi:hypothetical protein|nr:hypothetical protein [Bacteroidales bacterium]